MAYIAYVLTLFLIFDIGACYLYYKEPELEDGACPGKPNTVPPWEDQPTLVKTIANGSLYTAGNGDDQLFGRDT